MKSAFPYLKVLIALVLSIKADGSMNGAEIKVK